ncbi:hypothetical protein PPL_10031 [Heterostelium album PN500]|uniref:Transcription factor CBF/NF-Y/archaeal histone domain-containing protein n=1 Tax=Heterostelium pallidum (strain ATCC 26659 / Pp 5 / PN500) TaxID=670386 RepID=D3BQ50_HETP5|nr:hypothetical protein PPL_10031 [Heterostelium album PN500]EFA76270.1 hypothetical protein PPL_10031 [Heterostelium album PN500]|eukprot:XP_020428402.1 hypothetical protein PPL_10031 [Heterostelium album PN500]
MNHEVTSDGDSDDEINEQTEDSNVSNKSRSTTSIDQKKLHPAMKSIAKLYNQKSVNQKSVNTMEKVLVSFLTVVLDHSQQKSNNNTLQIQDIQSAMIELDLEFLLPSTGINPSNKLSNQQEDKEMINDYLYED